MEAFDRLCACLGRLPGLGRRSAERVAVRLVRQPQELLGPLIQALTDVQRDVCCCAKCGSVHRRERESLPLCTAAGRDPKALCVVEDPGDILTLERSGAFRGRYHALMGKLSPMRAKGPPSCGFRLWLKRVEQEEFEEVHSGPEHGRGGRRDGQLPDRGAQAAGRTREPSGVRTAGGQRGSCMPTPRPWPRPCGAGRPT